MIVIYKYELTPYHGSVQSFKIPEEHKVLSVQEQGIGQKERRYG